MIDCRGAALAFTGIPTIPVQVRQEGDEWKKRPLVDWSQATIDEATLDRWWRRWPDALPGIPLAKVGWCAIDVDDPLDPAWVETFTPMRMLGPHSKVRTPSGGMHYVFAQPPEPISKMQWSAGVEVLGTSRLLTVHDVDAVLFPRVAPRAILPKVFWEPYARPNGNPINNHPKRDPVRAVRDVAEVDVADATAALWQMDPRDWGKRPTGPRGRLIGDYHGWFALMCAAKFVGISEREFVRWSVSDPHYARDARKIERMWERCEPRHGGAFWAALAARGIRLRRGTPVFNGVSIEARAAVEAPGEAKPSIKWKGDLRDHSRRLIGWLNTEASEDRLFRVACIFAERGMLREVAEGVLKSDCAALRQAMGAAEFSRTIANAYAHITAKEKSK